jgi:hypothetical protein
MRVALVCPARDAELTLRATVLAGIETTERLVVVDDGSVDRTREIADQLMRAHASKMDVFHQARTGIGAAVRRGFEALCERDGVDAVGVLVPSASASGTSFDARLLTRFREVLHEMPAVDVVMGSHVRAGEWGPRAASFVIQASLGYWGMTDALGGLFLVRTSILRQMDVGAIADGEHFESTMLAELRRIRATFATVPSGSGAALESSTAPPVAKTLMRATGFALRRAIAGPDRLGIALLALSIPTLGATLPLAAARLKRTSPKVTKLTK